MLPPAHWLRLGMVGVTGAMLAACGSSSVPAGPAKDDGRGTYKIGRTYTVMGQTYTPHEDPDYHEEGQASWYGPGFHGKRTANGEVYDQTDRTAAHRTLPMPSVVLVTNLDNGRSTIVRVNDRGPFARDRVIDLSRAAADDLDMFMNGVANVRVDILRRESEIVKEIAIGGGGKSEQMAAVLAAQRQAGPPPAGKPASAVASRPAPAAAIASAPRPAPANGPQAAGPPITMASYVPPAADAPPAIVPAAYTPAVAAAARAPASRPPSGPAYYVQAGAFGTLANAERARARVAALGETAITSVNVQGQELFRVRLGPLNSAAAADSVRAEVQRAGLGDARIVTD